MPDPSPSPLPVPWPVPAPPPSPAPWLVPLSRPFSMTPSRSAVAAGRCDHRRDEHARRQRFRRPLHRLRFGSGRGHGARRFLHAAGRDQDLFRGDLGNGTRVFCGPLRSTLPRWKRILQAAATAAAARSRRHEKYQPRLFAGLLHRGGFDRSGAPPQDAPPRLTHGSREDATAWMSTAPPGEAGRPGDGRKQRFGHRLDKGSGSPPAVTGPHVAVARGGRRRWRSRTGFRQSGWTSPASIRLCTTRCRHACRARDLFGREDVRKDLGMDACLPRQIPCLVLSGQFRGNLQAGQDLWSESDGRAVLFTPSAPRRSGLPHGRRGGGPA